MNPYKTTYRINLFSPCTLSLTDARMAHRFINDVYDRRDAHRVIASLIEAFGNCANKSVAISEFIIHRNRIEAKIITHKTGFRDNYRHLDPLDAIHPRIYGDHGVVTIKPSCQISSDDLVVHGLFEQGTGFTFIFGLKINDGCNFITCLWNNS